MAENIRPTKKQRELLEFIQSFINEHHYSPSYREIMTGLNYTSVATVALHVNNLIKRGHLIRRDGKARSLEVANGKITTENEVSTDPETHEEWLLGHVKDALTKAEDAEERTHEHLSNAETLLETLSILDIDTDEHDFDARLQELRRQA